MNADDLIQINIAGRMIGILGFKTVLEEIGPNLAQADDDLLSNELLVRLSKNNYIPETVKADYGKALVREFRRQLGQPVPEEKPSGLVIKVLGQGCNNCRELTRRIMDVMGELNLAGDLEHVTDIKAIAQYGVLGSPGLIINGQVKAVGSVPSKKQLADWLQQAGV
ncbi:MAG: thioredoxin family protein [Desulfobacterota bacterium]|nr:thioredoxin family protein [Thermodesulfobacteriota bacterium]